MVYSRILSKIVKTYGELGLNFGECISSNAIGDLEISIGTLGEDSSALVGGRHSQGRDGEGEEKGSLEVHNCGEKEGVIIIFQKKKRMIGSKCS